MKRTLLVLVAALSLGVLVGCSSAPSGPATEIELTAKDMAFGSNELTVETGKTYRLVFRNNDAVEHDFAITKMPVKVGKESHKEGHGSKKVALHVHSDPGKAEYVEFTPTQAGTYEFICTVAGHKDAGMVGKLVVK